MRFSISGAAAESSEAVVVTSSLALPNSLEFVGIRTKIPLGVDQELIREEWRHSKSSRSSVVVMVAVASWK